MALCFIRLLMLACLSVTVFFPASAIGQTSDTKKAQTETPHSESAQPANNPHQGAVQRPVGKDHAAGAGGPAATQYPAIVDHPAERPPLNKKLIVGVQLQNPPFSMQDEDGNWTGITVELWDQIARELGVEYVFKPLDLKTMVQDLKDGSLDVVAAGLGVTAGREAMFDFSTPYLVANEAVAVCADQQPSLLQTFRRAFLNWGLLTLIGSSIAITVGGALLLWLFETRGKADYYGGGNRTAFTRSLFWSLMVLVGRDLPTSIGWSTTAPKTLWARLFGIIWMMVGVLGFSLFTATVASVLTSKQLLSIVNSPQDLRHVRVGTVKHSVGQEYLDHEHIKYTAYGPGPVDLLTALTEHKIDAAVFNGPILNYYARTKFVEKVVVLRFSLRQDFMAIPMPAGSPLRKPINRTLLRVIDSKKWQSTLSTYLGND